MAFNQLSGEQWNERVNTESCPLIHTDLIKFTKCYRSLRCQLCIIRSKQPQMTTWHAGDPSLTFAATLAPSGPPSIR